MRWSIPAMGVKFVNPPLELGLKYHDPPPLVIMIKSGSCNTLGWVSIMKTQIFFYLFFVMLYTYILDDRIKSLTLILTADYLTLLFLPGFFFLPNKELPFSSLGEPLHDHGHIFAWPSPFNGPFFMTPPFSKSQKVVTLPLFPPLPPANFWQIPKIGRAMALFAKLWWQVRVLNRKGFILGLNGFLMK